MATNDTPAKTESALQQLAVTVDTYAKRLLTQERAKQFVAQLAIMSKKEPKFAKCTTESLLAAMIACMHLDLMPNTPEQYAFVIPYYNKKFGRFEAQFQVGYKGMQELGFRSGQIFAMNAELVFTEDTFDVELGTERRLIHRPDIRRDRTKLEEAIVVYATAKLANGEVVFELLPLSDLEKIKQVSKTESANTPWKSWPESMAKKTAVKRLLKWLPQSAKDNRLVMAAYYDSLAEAGKLRVKDGEITPDSTESEPLSLEDQKAITNEAKAIAGRLKADEEAGTLPGNPNEPKSPENDTVGDDQAESGAVASPDAPVTTEEINELMKEPEAPNAQ